MEQYVIKGKTPLRGEVVIGGAKNAALGILAAAVMTDGHCKIENMPNQDDYASMRQVNYEDLKKSERFTPALYREKDGVWEGGSISQFSPVMKLKLW